MIGLLSGLLSTVAAIGTTIAWAIETVVNVGLVAVAAAAAAALALLPSMSDAATIGTPQWLQWLNYFLPIGGLLALLTAGIVTYVAFLGLRYVLRIARAL